MAAYVYIEPLEPTADQAAPAFVCKGQVVGVPGESTSLNSAPTYVSIRETDDAGSYVKHPDFPDAVVTKIFWAQMGPHRYRFFSALLDEKER